MGEKRKFFDYNRKKRRRLIFKRIRFVFIILTLGLVIYGFNNYFSDTNKLSQEDTPINLRVEFDTSLQTANALEHSNLLEKKENISDESESLDNLESSDEPQSADDLQEDITNSFPEEEFNSNDTSDNFEDDKQQNEDAELIVTKTPQENFTEVSIDEPLSNAETSKTAFSLKKSLAEYISKFKGKYGIYYYNISTNEEFGINEEDEYVAASTIKIPLNLYLFKKISSGESDPKGIMPYLEEDYETGTGRIQYEKFGTTYTLEQLSKLSIVSSDNVATNILFRYLGKWNVTDYMRKLGGKVVYDYKNMSSPKDMGIYMRVLYNYYLNDKTYGKQLMDYFLNTDFNDRLPALLPKSVKVAHKIGNQVGVTNDVGIVFAKSPYIVSVMSKNIDESLSSNVIAEISKKIYVWVEGTN